MNKTLIAIFAALLLAPMGHALRGSPKVSARTGCAERMGVGTPRLAYLAVVKSSAVAFRAPGHRPFAHFLRVNANGARTVFSIRDAVFDSQCRPAWYHVQLPRKPNGVTGYVKARSVLVGIVRTRIVVDLSAKLLTFYRDGHRVLRVPIGIGSPSTPTPRGDFYVNQRVVAADPKGPFGPSALGISAFSEVLTDWTQGGPIAVHGTNNPGSIGRAVSTGCIHLRNDVMQRLFAATPAGTPVSIRA
jgi:hypothetical protein